MSIHRNNVKQSSRAGIKIKPWLINLNKYNINYKLSVHWSDFDPQATYFSCLYCLFKTTILIIIAMFHLDNVNKLSQSVALIKETVNQTNNNKTILRNVITKYPLLE